LYKFKNKFKFKYSLNIEDIAFEANASNNLNASRKILDCLKSIQYYNSESISIFNLKIANMASKFTAISIKRRLKWILGNLDHYFNVFGKKYRDSKFSFSYGKIKQPYINKKVIRERISEYSEINEFKGTKFSLKEPINELFILEKINN